MGTALGCRADMHLPSGRFPRSFLCAPVRPSSTTTTTSDLRRLQSSGFSKITLSGKLMTPSAACGLKPSLAVSQTLLAEVLVLSRKLGNCRFRVLAITTCSSSTGRWLTTLKTSGPSRFWRVLPRYTWSFSRSAMLPTGPSNVVCLK